MKQLIGFIILFALVAFKQPENNHFDNYIKENYKTAQEFQKEYGVPASIQLAQAWYESHGGTSNVAKCSNNHFGIKAFNDWSGKTCPCEDNSKVRAYDSVYESYKDHAIFLNKYYKGAIGKDWKHWVKWCKGYGGHPNYWGELGKIIEQNELWKYDRI